MMLITEYHKQSKISVIECIKRCKLNKDNSKEK